MTYNTFVVPLELQPLPPANKKGDLIKRHAYQRLGIEAWVCRGCGHHTKLSPFVKTSGKCRPFSPVIMQLFTEYVDAQSTLGHSLRIANVDPLTKVV